MQCQSQYTYIQSLPILCTVYFQLKEQISYSIISSLLLNPALSIFILLVSDWLAGNIPVSILVVDEDEEDCRALGQRSTGKKTNMPFEKGIGC